MEESKTSRRLAKQTQAIEETYRRGYHHGFYQAMDLIFGLLDEGMPPRGIRELATVFLEQYVAHWRVLGAEGSSAPPHFDVEEVQRTLRELKQRQSME